MVLDTSVSIAENAVKSSEEFAGENLQPGFFEGFADCGLEDSFTKFDDASGERPLALQRRLGALDERDASAVGMDDDGSDAGQRELGIFAGHECDGNAVRANVGS